MFKVYNHSSQREEMVAKIDLNKHWKSFGVPFDVIPEEEKEIVEKPTKTKKSNTLILWHLHHLQL